MGYFFKNQIIKKQIGLQNTLYSVESLIKKHDGFEKTVKAQEERIDDLKQFAHDLCDQDHYAADEIKACCQKVLTRCGKMWDDSHARRKKLEDSKNYQLFLRKIYEVMYLLYSIELFLIPASAPQLV